MRLDREPFEFGVVAATRFGCIELPVGDPPQELHERERVFAGLDLAPEQCRPRPVATRVLEQQECVVGRITIV